MINKGIIESIKNRISPCLDGLETSLERAANDFKPLDSKLSLIFSGFREKEARELKGLLAETLDLLRSPIYVGFLGRYSHGKSSLVNALLDLQDGSNLPVGDQVTTSMVCVVEFDDQIIEREFIAVELDSDKTIDTYAKFTKRITSASDLEQGSASSYMLRIPVNPGNDISRMFEKSSISLVDMPGLGGPYFNDTMLTNSYIQDLDMVCIVINSCKIHEAAIVINDHIERSKAKLLPKIIVATFWDEARKSIEYQSCEDELARQAHFKKLVKENMASLNDSIGEILFVDSVSRERTGIKELRQQIRSKVEGTTLLTAGTRSKHQTSGVFKRKLTACRRKLGELSSSMSASLSHLEEKVRNSQSRNSSDREVKKELESIVHNATKRIEKFSRYEAGKHLKDADFKFKTAVKTLKTVGNEEELSEAKEEIEQDINSNIIPDLKESLKYSYRTAIADEFSREVKAFLGQLSADSRSAEWIEERIEDSCEDVFEADEPFEFPEGIVAAVEKEVKSIVGTLMKSITSPQNIMLIIGGILLLTIASFLDIAILPKAIFTILQIAGFATIAMAVYRIVPTYQREREKAFRAVLKKRLSGFEKSFSLYLKSNFDINSFRDKVRNMISEVERDLQKEMSPHLELSREVISTLETMRGNVENALEDLEREVQKI